MRSSDAIAAGREVSQTLTLRRADGSRLTCRAVLSPVRAEDAVTHWVVALQDLTEQLTHDAEQAALVEAERRERRSLGLIAQVSDLLMDVDDPHALREIAAMLRRDVVGWAQFYLDDGGLRPADGIVAGQVLSGRGARHRNVLRPRGHDAVQLLLDGQNDRPFDLALDGSYAPGSASAWLAKHVLEQLARSPPTTTTRRCRRTGRSSSFRCPAVAGCSGCSSSSSSAAFAGSNRRRARCWS